MIIRGIPHDVDNYIKVNGSINEQIVDKGFFPKYFDGQFSYYEKNDKFLLVYYSLKKGGDNTK